MTAFYRVFEQNRFWLNSKLILGLSWVTRPAICIIFEYINFLFRRLKFMRKHFYIQNSITLKMLLLYHPKADSIKDVYAALMRRQMQWSHLISDKWAPRFHSLWSRSSFLVSTFHLFFCQRNHVCGHFSALQICREGAKTQHWAGTIYERNYLLPVGHNVVQTFLNSHFCFYASTISRDILSSWYPTSANSFRPWIVSPLK